MAVADLVQLFESIDSLTSRHPSEVSSYRMKLSLQTMFHNSRSRTRGSVTSSPSSSLRSSPQTPSRSPSRAQHSQMPSSDLSSLFSPLSASSSPSSTITRRMRRQPSAIDVALEQERFAYGPEHIGLGLLEPRPRSGSLIPAEKSCSWMEFMHESQQAPVVLDGIFEVMESC